MAFGPKAIGTEEFGTGLSARARSTREAQLRAAVGVEAQHVPESVRGARLEITKQFEAFRALGGQTGTFSVSEALRSAAEGEGAPGSGHSPGNYLLPRPSVFTPQRIEPIGNHEAGIGVTLTTIL